MRKEGKSMGKEEYEEKSWFKSIVKLALFIVVVKVIFDKIKAWIDKVHKEEEKKNLTKSIKTHSIIAGGEVFKVGAEEEFKGMNLNCIMGGVQLDLSEAEFTSDVVLNCKVIMGGIEITIPEGVNVVFGKDAKIVAGGIESKAECVEGAPELLINYDIKCGGISIKTPDEEEDIDEIEDEE